MTNMNACAGKDSKWPGREENSVMQEKEKTIEELIYEETDQRLQEMASPDYEFPKKADKKDWIGIIASCAVCLMLIVLCMVGVIE